MQRFCQQVHIEIEQEEKNGLKSLDLFITGKKLEPNLSELLNYETILHPW